VIDVWSMHNAYRSGLPSGENTGVGLIADLLRSRGVNVTGIWPSTDDYTPSRRVSLAVRQILNSTVGIQLPDGRPDLAFIHNTFPSFTAKELELLLLRGIPLVRVVHNYRLTCLRGDHLRDDQSCRECIQRRPTYVAGVKYACFNQSRTMSSVVAMATVHLRQLDDAWSRFVAISPFVAEYLTTIGIRADRIVTIPNAVRARDAIAKASGDFLFAGRLDRGKGVHLLLEAWALSGLGRTQTLNIAGDGPEASQLRAKAAELTGVTFRGALSGQELETLARRCKVAIAPGIWHEPFGRVAAEALSRGQALVVTDKGALRDFVESGVNGFVVPPDASALAAAMVESLDLRDHVEFGRRRWLERFSPEVVAGQWLDLCRSLATNDPRPH
jgi:glycosyltransferase involved in cell wall biosynthesis